MGTSCKIGYENKDGSIQYTRLNWDGYPDYAGRYLLRYFNTEDKAKEIASSKEIRSIYNFGSLELYDDSSDSQISEMKTFINNCGNEDYGYLWKDGCWYILNKHCWTKLEYYIKKYIDNDKSFDGPDLYDSDCKNLES